MIFPVADSWAHSVRTSAASPLIIRSASSSSADRSGSSGIGSRLDHVPEILSLPRIDKRQQRMKGYAFAEPARLELGRDCLQELFRGRCAGLPAVGCATEHPRIAVSRPPVAFAGLDVGATFGEQQFGQWPYPVFGDTGSGVGSALGADHEALSHHSALGVALDQHLSATLARRAKAFRGGPDGPQEAAHGTRLRQRSSHAAHATAAGTRMDAAAISARYISHPWPGDGFREGLAALRGRAHVLAEHGEDGALVDADDGLPALATGDLADPAAHRVLTGRAHPGRPLGE